MAAAKRELENRQKVVAPKVEGLYGALSAGKWPDVLSTAEAVLAHVPEHPAARQARARVPGNRSRQLAQRSRPNGRIGAVA